jgi:hypothetical protein
MAKWQKGKNQQSELVAIENVLVTIRPDLTR